MKQLLILLIFTLLIATLPGCKATEISRKQLATEVDAINANTMHRGVFYIGSDEQHHFFVVKWKLQRDKLFKVPKTDIENLETIPVTKKEATWQSLMPALKENEYEGFKVLFTENNRYYLIKKRGNT